jgi:hypothetical protein
MASWINSMNQTMANKVITDAVGYGVGYKTAKKLGANETKAHAAGAVGAFVADVVSTQYSLAEKVVKGGQKVVEKISNYVSNEINRLRDAGYRLDSELDKGRRRR